MKHAALFVDLDGTLRESSGPLPFPRNGNEVRLINGMGKIIAQWKRAGYLVLAVTNQSGVAGNAMTEEDFWESYDRTNELLTSDDDEAIIDDIAVEFGPVEHERRKPAATMGLELAEQYNVSLKDSYFSGDMESDAQFAHNLGVHFIPAKELRTTPVPPIAQGNQTYSAKPFDKQQDHLGILAKLPDNELEGKHFLLHNLWNSLKGARKVGGYSKKEIEAYHAAVVEELAARGIRHTSPLKGVSTVGGLLIEHAQAHATNDQKRHDAALKELKSFGIGHPEENESNLLDQRWIYKGNFLPVGPSGNVQGDTIKLEEILEALQGKEAHVRFPFISLVGGLVNNSQTDNDIDILISAAEDELGERLKYLLQYRILRALPAKYTKRVHFIFANEDATPISSYIPLYALSLAPLKAETVQMSLDPCTTQVGKNSPVATQSTEAEDLEPVLKKFPSLGTFFKMPKPIKPVKEDQPQTKDYFFSLFQESDYPLEITKKYDGIACQLHKQGDKVTLFTEEGNDITSRFPLLTKEVQERVKEDCILIGEIEAWAGRTHLPRQEVTAHIMRKEGDDAGLILTVFDTVYLQEPIANESLSVRRAKLKSIPWPQTTMGIPSMTSSLNLAPGEVVTKQQELEEALAKIGNFPGSEGIVAKILSSAYPTETDTSSWVKWHNFVQLTTVVIEQKESKVAGVYNYLVGLTKGEKPAHGDSVTVGEYTVYPAGWTFSTKNIKKPGELLVIEAENLNYIVHPDGVESSLYAARVVDVPPATPDTIGSAMKLAESAQVLQGKRIAKGYDVIKAIQEANEPIEVEEWIEEEVEYAELMHKVLVKDGFTSSASFSQAGALYPQQGARIRRPEKLNIHLTDFWEALKEMGGQPEFSSAIEIATPDKLFPRVHFGKELNNEGERIYVTIFATDGSDIGKAVLGSHSTAEFIIPNLRSSFSIAEDEDTEWVPQLHVNKVADPYLEIPAEDKEYNYLMQRHFRGKSEHIDFRLQTGTTKLLGWTLADLVQGTIKEPILTVEAAKQVPETCFKINLHSGDVVKRPPKVGSTKEVNAEIIARRKAPEPADWFGYEGAFGGSATEDVEVGSTRNYPGVFINRDQGTLEYGAQKADMHEYFLDGKMKGRYFIKQLPSTSIETNKSATIPSQEIELNDEFTWLFIKPLDQTPYVLSKRAVEKGWLPPVNYSAVPTSIRKQIPEQYHYWKEVDEGQRQKVRDALVEALAKKEVVIDAIKATTNADFTIQVQTFKAKKIVRDAPSLVKWHLNVLSDSGDKFHFVAEGTNPFDAKVASFLLTSEYLWDKMYYEGSIEPGTVMNTTRSTPSSISVFDKGRVNLLGDSTSSFSASFYGRILIGEYTMTLGDSGIWALTKK